MFYYRRLKASSIKTRIETYFYFNPENLYRRLKASSIKTRIETNLSILYRRQTITSKSKFH